MPGVPIKSSFQFERALVEAGLFDDFNARVAELKAGAKTKAERGAAWRRARAEYLGLLREHQQEQRQERQQQQAPSDWPLVDPAVFGERTCTPAEGVAWAAQNAGRGDVGPEQAPGPIAWTFLSWIRHGGAGEFWRSLGPDAAAPQPGQRAGGRSPARPAPPAAH